MRLIIVLFALIAALGLCSALTTLTDCSNLTTFGETYVMLNNVEANNSFPCMNISAANITLNCGSYNITGNSTSKSAGVNVTAANITVKNCNITRVNSGICSYGQFGRFANNGQYMNNTINVSVATNTPPCYSGAYVFYNSSNNNFVTNSTIYGAVSGFYVITTGQNNTFANSYSKAGYGAVISISSSFNLIENDTLEGGITPSYALYFGSNSNTANHITTTSTAMSTLIVGAHYNTIENSDLFGIPGGLYLSTANNNTIFNNTIHCNANTLGTYGALLVVTSKNNTIKQNTITCNNTYAVYFSFANTYSFNNTLYNNTISSNVLPIFMGIQSGQNKLILNNISNYYLAGTIPYIGELVQDSNGTNAYNGTYQDSKNEGNLWGNITQENISGDSYSIGYTTLYDGSVGIDYPYGINITSGAYDNVPIVFSPNNDSINVTGSRINPSPFGDLSHNLTGWCNVTSFPTNPITALGYTWNLNGSPYLSGSITNGTANWSSGVEVNVSVITAPNLAIAQFYTLTCSPINYLNVQKTNVSANTVIISTATSTTSSEINFVALVLVGICFIYFAIEGEDV